jgi:hypothetical protein
MKWLFSLAVAASFIGIFPQAFAQAAEVVPKLINYQGKLTDVTGQPLAGDAGGTFRLKFEIFVQATGGNAVWAEERDVVVIGGIFNVALGGAGGDEVVGISDDLGVAFAGPTRFLQTTIVSGPTITEAQTLAPRQQLVSTPFAMVAQTTDRAAVAALAESLLPELQKALNPPGTIITYAGGVGNDTGGVMEPIPGYLLCNGAVIDGTALAGKYAALRTALGNAWGDGGTPANAQVVNLPDLRGVFLRGWNGGATDGFADPDRASRVARRAGGNTVNNVGSFQMDELKSHFHPYDDLYHNIDNSVDDSAGGSLADNTTRTSRRYTLPSGGLETRPKNANVVYLIKY